MKFYGTSLDLTAKKIINLASPTDAGDAVNKAYIDAVVVAIQSVNGTPTQTLLYNTSGATWPVRPPASVAPAGSIVWVSSASAPAPPALVYDIWRKF